jgi:hypothetical protein
MNPDSATRPPGGLTRRSFLQQSALAATALAGARFARLAADPPPAGAANASSTVGLPLAGALPWYRRACRWGQTNIAEIDPTRYDISWWREQWRRTRVQGVIVNAGGIVAFYPTQVPLQRRAQFLGDRDLFGELRQAARADGLAVFARMDSNGADEDFYHAHPDWFTVDANGQPYRARDLYVACVNGPYYAGHIPAILREIAARYQPEGFADNSWSGLPRNRICYCKNCVQAFAQRTGRALPAQLDWDNQNYRAWIEWGYETRLAVWDNFNAVTRAAGGPECLWVGMNGGTISGAAQDFRDYREIGRRAEIILLDNQRRDDPTGFQANGEAGRLVHGLLGWDKLIPESMAMYQAGPTFRLSSKPEQEARLWMLDGLAGGISPWWHYVNAYQEDRRMYETPVAVCQWQAANEQYLLNREPVATVGVVYSQRDNDYFGREDADLLVNLPQRGIIEALRRARIPYGLVNADDLARAADGLRLLILPNLGVMTDAQVDAVRGFVKNGGGLLATGWSSLFDAAGDLRPDFALADLFGVHLPASQGGRDEATRRQWAAESVQSYLRLTPELRAGVDGPHIPGEPPAVGRRHEVLQGFDETDILPFGGTLEALSVEPSAQVLTFIPAIPVMPPENVWMRTPKTDIAGLVLNEAPGRGRVAYLAADLDRRYARENLPDHGDLLANLVRWAARGDFPLTVAGPGFLDCYLYRQPGRAIVHLVNLTNAAAWRAPVEELLPVGPLRVAVKLPADVKGASLKLLVSDQKPALTVPDGWARFELGSILDHEVAVVE